MNLKGLPFGLNSSIFTTGGLVFISHYQKISLKTLRYFIFGSAITDSVADGIGMYKETIDPIYGIRTFLFKFLFCIGFILPTFIPHYKHSLIGHILLIISYLLLSTYISFLQETKDITEIETKDITRPIYESLIVFLLLLIYLGISILLKDIL